MLYNFRIGPEATFLIVNTVIGAALTTLLATNFTSITDWKAWAIGFAIALGRTLIGAILAASSGGGFQKPGQPGPLTTATATAAGGPVADAGDAPTLNTRGPNGDPQA